jgi:hypothetical protein
LFKALIKLKNYYLKTRILYGISTTRKFRFVTDTHESRITTPPNSGRRVHSFCLLGKVPEVSINNGGSNSITLIFSEIIENPKHGNIIKLTSTKHCKSKEDQSGNAYCYDQLILSDTRAIGCNEKNRLPREDWDCMRCPKICCVLGLSSYTQKFTTFTKNDWEYRLDRNPIKITKLFVAHDARGSLPSYDPHFSLITTLIDQFIQDCFKGKPQSTTYCSLDTLPQLVPPPIQQLHTTAPSVSQQQQPPSTPAVCPPTQQKRVRFPADLLNPEEEKPPRKHPRAATNSTTATSTIHDKMDPTS